MQGVNGLAVIARITGFTGWAEQQGVMAAAMGAKAAANVTGAHYVGVTARAIGGAGGGTNGTGNLLQNILGGGGVNTNRAGTNQPADTNQSPVNNLLNRILK